jgi:hypothetical protein
MEKLLSPDELEKLRKSRGPTHLVIGPDFQTGEVRFGWNFTVPEVPDKIYMSAMKYTPSEAREIAQSILDAADILERQNGQ